MEATGRGNKASEMETGGICPSMALGLIAEGKDQVVEIDHKTMLFKVMQALGAKEMPVFKIIDCAEQGVKVAIKLDVSAAKYSVGQKITTTVVEGDPSPYKLVAEKSAVLKAMNNLSDQHLIKVLDYSSKVINSNEGHRVFGELNTALYSVEKIIGQWEGNIGRCKQMAVKLEGKGSEQAGDADVYQSLSEFATMLLERFNEKLTTARGSATELEFARKKYLNRSTEKYHATLRKGHLQNVVLTAKEVLEYVLNYLGGGKPQYTNGPTSYGLMKGVVTFYMPCVSGIDCCGNITIKGKSMRSMDAEDDAAFHALQFMENMYKLKIVDINHQDRVQCEKERKLLVRLLEQTIDVATDVKKYWGKMVATINTEQRAYSVDPTNIFSGTNARKKIEAHRFCAKELNELAKASNNAYADCESRFDEMKKMEHNMQETKASLGME